MNAPPSASPTPATASARALPRSWARYSAIELLVALVILMITAPLIEDLPSGDVIESALLTVVMVSAVVAIGGTRRTLVVALLLLAPALFGKWANHLSPGRVSHFVYLVPATLFFFFVVGHLVRFILRAPRVDANVLCAGLSGYLLLGLLWTPLYMAVFRWNVNGFTMPAGTTMDGFSAFYFSFMTLSTVGYGDIAPASRAARMLAITEAVAGLFYVAVLISRLVAIYSSASPTPQPPEETGTTRR
ncbi:MAG TPA: potassium channel family protein [Candidatus Acidoferrum sp.]|nr:potassium channel family protein [Candidatus Acidoferrum sp.]